MQLTSGNLYDKKFARTVIIKVSKRERFKFQLLCQGDFMMGACKQYLLVML